MMRQRLWKEHDVQNASSPQLPVCDDQATFVANQLQPLKISYKFLPTTTQPNFERSKKINPKNPIA